MSAYTSNELRQNYLAGGVSVVNRLREGYYILHETMTELHCNKLNKESVFPAICT